MPHIESILKVSEQGISRPFLCRDELGGIRWCKGSHTGFRSLVSEWICARLALEIGLPIPDFRIFRLDCAEFGLWRKMQNAEIPDLVTEANQFVFGSLNVENCKDVLTPRTDLGHIAPKVLAAVYWFDRLIHNTDRTDYNSNLLVNGSIYIIDHNNAFDPAFSDAEFVGEHLLRDYRGAISPIEVSALKKRVGELARGEFLDQAWDEMPAVWADVCESVLPLATIRRVITEACDA